MVIQEIPEVLATPQVERLVETARVRSPPAVHPHKVVAGSLTASLADHASSIVDTKSVLMERVAIPQAVQPEVVLPVERLEVPVEIRRHV